MVYHHRDQTQIHKRLLFSLGIEGGGGGPTEIASISRGTVRSTPELPSSRFGDCHMQDDSSSSSSSSSSSLGRKKRLSAGSVRFTKEAPSVVEIPSHRDYPEEIRQQIWMGREEIEVNAQRNRMEYLADGCDYRKVTEENRMIRWPQTGELIHPATYWIRYEEQQQQELLSLQQEEFSFASASSSSSTPSHHHHHHHHSMGLRKSPTITSLTGMAA